MPRRKRSEPLDYTDDEIAMIELSLRRPYPSGRESLLSDEAQAENQRESDVWAEDFGALLERAAAAQDESVRNQEGEA